PPRQQHRLRERRGVPPLGRPGQGNEHPTVQQPCAWGSRARHAVLGQRRQPIPGTGPWKWTAAARRWLATDEQLEGGATAHRRDRAREGLDTARAHGCGPDAHPCPVPRGSRCEFPPTCQELSAGHEGRRRDRSVVAVLRRCPAAKGNRVLGLGPYLEG